MVFTEIYILRTWMAWRVYGGRCSVNAPEWPYRRAQPHQKGKS